MTKVGYLGRTMRKDDRLYIHDGTRVIVVFRVAKCNPGSCRVTIAAPTHLRIVRSTEALEEADVIKLPARN